MEKTISPEERIRRAEELYYRRKSYNNSIRMSSAQVKDGKEKKQFFLYKKVIIQVLVCILIYLVFSLIKEANYIFSEDILVKTKEFLSTDINFEVVVNRTNEFFQNNQDKLDLLSGWVKDGDEQNDNEEVENQEDEENVNEEVENQVDTEIQNAATENITNEAQNSNNEESSTIVASTLTGVGGASSNEVVVSTASTSDSSSKTQMQLDAEYIKSNFSMVLPLKGTITSHYGEREETEIVSANHLGIDIGVEEGTTIVAAMEGTVSLVSDEGEYGTHVKIVNEDVTTIYAHCSKILVKEGDTVTKGQQIALSGNTGKSTGPHLHFEIRRDNRTVDPELVLTWE